MRGLSGVLSIAASLTGCALLWGTGELEFQDQPAAGGGSSADGGGTTSGGSTSAGGSAGASAGGSGTGAAGGGDAPGAGVGDPCVDPDACAAGLFCADGVCCTSACDGTCEACDGNNAGTCTPVALWQDPATECVADALGCDGTGQCATCGFAPAAPGGASCPAVCDSCDPLTGTCQIECTTNAECEATVVSCPPDWACNVVCDANYACKNAVINCPDDYACTVSCLGGGNEPCNNTSVNCATNGPCDVTCEGDQCDQGDVACGANECTVDCLGSGAKVPTVVCGSSCSCDNGC